MPEKYHVTRSSFSGPSGYRKAKSYTTLTYNPDCGIPPWIVPGQSFDEVRSHEGLLQEYVTESHWISGQTGPKPKELPMNYCHHLVSKLQLPNDGELKLKRNSYSKVEREILPGHCQLSDWIASEQVSDETLVLRYGPDTWLSLMGSGNGPLNWDPYLPIGTALFNTKVSQLDSIAVSAMVPQLDTGFSLPLFLAEILSVKALVVNALKLLRSLPSAIAALLRRGLTLKQLSNGWLEGIFGWLPLVRDIKTIFEKFYSMKDSVLSYLRGSNKRKTLHFKKGLSPLTFRDALWFDPISVELGFDTKLNPYRGFTDLFEELSLECDLSREVSDLKYSATMEFEYRIPNAESLIASIWGSLDHWGINFSPSDVWEYIPFSFVIDWFASVGPMIARLDKTNLQVQVIVYDFCRSFKYRLTQQAKIVDLSLLRINGEDDTEGWTTPVSEQAYWKVSSYYRVPGFPSLTPEQLLELKLPHGMTLVTGAALADQQLRDRLIRLLSRRSRRR